MATFLLLHGSFCRKGVWKGTADALVADGHRVEALELPSSGSNASDLGGLDDDTATVSRALDEAGPSSVLVGHSGAGMVLAELGDHPAVGHSVYVAALRPQPGQSMADMLGEQVPDWMAPRPHDGVIGVSGEPEVVRRAVCADVEQDRFLREVYPRYVLTSLRSLADVSMAPAGRHGTTYVICEQDQALPPTAQEAMSTTTDHVERLPSSHSPLLSMPARLAQVLEKAAAGT